MKQQFAYAAWRTAMWLKGYGTTFAIDAAVERGDLVPMKDYPATDRAFPDPRGECE